MSSMTFESLIPIGFIVYPLFNLYVAKAYLPLQDVREDTKIRVRAEIIPGDPLVASAKVPCTSER